MDTSAFNGIYHRAIEESPGVLLLEFSRAPVNAFNDEMWSELGMIIERISKSPEVRVVVLSSSLDAIFSAGLDLDGQTILQDGVDADPSRRAVAMRSHLLDFQAAVSSLERCRQPIIAALFGISLGLAIDLASACDIRLTASDAQFGIIEINVGLAADMGTLQRLPKIVGNESKVRELALTGRRFDAVEAKDLGFVSHIVSGGRKDVIRAALDLAATIASKSPVAVFSTKHLLNHARDHSIDEGLVYTAAWNMVMLQSEDTARAIKAARGRQSLQFPSLSAKL